MTAIARYRDRDAPKGLFGLQQLERVLDEAFSRLPFSNIGDVITAAWLPPCDVYEDEDSLKIVMEVPGIRPDDVKLSLEDTILTVRGEKRQEADEESGRVHRHERSYGVFERTFALPAAVDPNKIEAQYENGILTITIPKAEHARLREIPVNTGGARSTEQTVVSPR